MNLYEYRFVQNQTESLTSNSILKRRLYSFKSFRTNQVYNVIIDECTHNVHVIKFYLKAHRHSPKRYNLLTNLNEPRSVLMTCLNIAIKEIHQKDKTASFGFVASNIIGEQYESTKRFRIYERFIQTFIGEETFAHYKYEDYSAYVLIPNIALQNDTELDKKIFSLFKEHDFCEVV